MEDEMIADAVIQGKPYQSQSNYQTSDIPRRISEKPQNEEEDAPSGTAKNTERALVNDDEEPAWMK